MALDDNTANISSALRAVSACPRQPIHRPVKEPSYEVASHVKAYLDHKHYEQGYEFLYSLLAAGNSISKPATPYVGLLAPTTHLTLASTLIVYPLVTTKASSADVLKGSDAALKYLRCVQETVRGPGYEFIRQAFSFTDTRRRALAPRTPVKNVAVAVGSDMERLEAVAANERSLWYLAEDFWHIVGWAFNCSVIHKKRWARWKLWLDLILDFLETEWEDCIKHSNKHPEEREHILQDSLIWRYISTQDPTVGNTRRRIFKAVFASADQQSLQQYPEIWEGETEETKPKESKKRPLEVVDFETGEMADYASEEEDIPMPDAPRSSVRGRRPKDAQENSLPSLEEAFLPDYETAVERLGGMDAVELRQRFLALLVEVARELPNRFASLEGVIDALTTQMCYFPVNVLNVLITTSHLSPADQLALNVDIMTTLTSERYPNYTIMTPTQEHLEQFLLPHRARTFGFAANAKLSLLVEQVFMYMMEHTPLEATSDLRRAVTMGIKERCSVKGLKQKADEEEFSEALLKTSSERLRILLEVVEAAKGHAFVSFSGSSALSSAPESEPDG